MREIELKFEIDEDAVAAVRGAAALADAPALTETYRTVYYDDPEGSITKSGASLRVRQAGERFVQTVKVAQGGSAGLFNRAEWEWPLTGFALDLSLLADTPLTGLRHDTLRPVSETRFERTVWEVARGGTRASVSLDQGAVRAGEAEAPLHELELELIEGKPKKLFALAEELAAAAPLRIGVLSKAERGDRLAAGKLGKASKAEPVVLDGSAKVRDGFAAIVAACLRHYRLNEAVLLQTDDAAALHQMRVAMRRLRSAFSLFGAAVRDEAYAELREELRWFTAQLGDARNLDVFMKRLPKKVGAADGEALVRDVLTTARAKAYATAGEAIRSQRLRLLLLRLLTWTAEGKWRSSGKAKAKLASFARKRLEKRWLAVAAYGADLSALPPEPLHRLRIDIKKMRYATEFLWSLFDAQAERRAAFTAGMEVLQEQLGELNDAHTARELVAALALPDDPARAFAQGLIGREPDRVELLKASEQAYAQMTQAAGFWRKA